MKRKVINYSPNMSGRNSSSLICVPTEMQNRFNMLQCRNKEQNIKKKINGSAKCVTGLVWSQVFEGKKSPY